MYRIMPRFIFYVNKELKKESKKNSVFDFYALACDCHMDTDNFLLINDVGWRLSQVYPT